MAVRARGSATRAWAAFQFRDFAIFQTTETAGRIRELLDSNLQEVFGEADPERRTAAVEELWAEDGILYVPPGAITGRDAISSFAGDLPATHP